MLVLEHLDWSETFSVHENDLVLGVSDSEDVGLFVHP